MKSYIFITDDIHIMGGMQNYVRSKATYLKQKGWKIYIIYRGIPNAPFAFDELIEYEDGVADYLLCVKAFLSGTLYSTIAVEAILAKIGYDFSCEETIIESHSDRHAVMGEIIANFINAKHMCFNCNEIFRGKEKCYEEFMDFFWFKYCRKELIGISKDSMTRLFDDYHLVKSNDFFIAANYDNVKDIYDPRLENIKCLDWNIGYIGRCEKSYFFNVISAILDLATKYANKEIQFVIVGVPGERERIMLGQLKSCKNIYVNILGFFNIFPKKLFEKLDVCIAGAGCGIISTKQGVPTIIPDAQTNIAAGILGYSVSSSLYGEKKYEYIELLEDILLYKKHINLKKLPILTWNTAEEYEKHFQQIDNSIRKKQYYSFKDNKTELTSFDKYRVVCNIFSWICDDELRKKRFIDLVSNKYGVKIGIFGYGEVGKKFVKICKPFLIIDNGRRFCANSSVFPLHAAHLEELSSIIITPIEGGDMMSKELKKQKYHGKIVMLTKLLDEYYHSLLCN
ncbi:MAG: hypothetical protein PHY47_14595 [Lachnospiraceae bacterium]|nr:hypothetical protein [Lachnospiraceae bacterium]